MAGMTEELVWTGLRRRLEEQVAGFPGAAGVALLDLRGSGRVAVNADDVFPTASTIKIAILAHLVERAEQGAVDLSRRVVVEPAQHVPGSGVLVAFDDPVELTVRDVAGLMIDVSDNTATNLCIEWATMDGVKGMLRRLGLTRTLLRRPMQDTAAIARGDENVSTPAELVELLRRLEAADGVSAEVAAETLRILRKPKRGYFQPGLPEGLSMANKTGGMGRVRNEAAIVDLPHRPYVLCVMSAWGPSDRVVQEQFLAGIAATVHDRLATLDATTTYGQSLP